MLIEEMALKVYGNSVLSSQLFYKLKTVLNPLKIYLQQN